ncbi:MAG: hypothetical protein E1N59_3134 [Puniceicoccaceae bacterium 5H]|nr:MAG: hypothetical protein E1N59_3134 [Puniceicoccaceae bacterium 5H]
MSRLRQRVQRRVSHQTETSAKSAALSHRLGAIGCLCFGLLYGWTAGSVGNGLNERIGAGVLALCYFAAAYGWRYRQPYTFILTGLLLLIEVGLNLYTFATTGTFASGWVHLILLLLVARAMTKAER